MVSWNQTTVLSPFVVEVFAQLNWDFVLPFEVH